MQKVAVVGDQDQAAGLLVQAADRGQARIPDLPAARQQVVDLLAVFLVRAGHAQRLVHHQHQRGRRIDGDAAGFALLISWLDRFDFWFEIVMP